MPPVTKLATDRVADASEHSEAEADPKSVSVVVQRWQDDPSMSIETALSTLPPALRGPVLEQIIPLELERRRRRGESPALDDYLAHFPEFKSILLPHFSTGHDSRSVANTVTVSSPVPAAAGRARASAPAPAIPGGLTRYQLLELLGTGGFAQVWRARDTLLDRPVAVKLLRPDRQASHVECESLLAEARRQGRLNVAGIVPVYDVTESSGSFYIVSKLIEGETLAALAKRERMTPAAAAKIVAQIAATLHQAHLQNIVHRDIKPSNILVDGSGAPWVSDFGIAVTEEELAGESSDVVGTYAYMSPEQASGRSNEVDARADVYGLGVILYELLTGRRPFVTTDPAKLIQEVIHRSPRPPRTIDDSIPRELEEICMRCLAKRVEDRYCTAIDLAESLQRFNDRSREDTASLKSISGSSWRSPNWVRLAAALALAFLSLASFAWWSQNPVFFAGPGAANPETSGSATAPSQSQVPPNRLEPALESLVAEPLLKLDTRWTRLFDQQPALLSWEKGTLTEAPHFDAPRGEYTVRTAYTRWFAAAHRLPSQPVEFRLALSVQDWQGFGGILWGLHELEAAFPDKKFHCYFAEYHQPDPAQTPKLAIREVTLIPRGIDGVDLADRRIIAMTEIERPQQDWAALELFVEAKRLRVRFDKKWEWEPQDLLYDIYKRDWLPPGNMAVGVTAQSREATFRDFSVRELSTPSGDAP